MMQGIWWDIFWAAFTLLWLIVIILFIHTVTEEVKSWQKK